MKVGDTGETGGDGAAGPMSCERGLVMYTLHVEKKCVPITAELERLVRRHADHLTARYGQLVELEVSIGLSRPRRGPPVYRVRLLMAIAGDSRRSVQGQPLVHLRAAMRTAFDAAFAHLAHHARNRRQERAVV